MTQAPDIETRLRDGLSLFADGRHGEAYGAVLDAVDASPGDPRLWEFLGTIALEGDRPWQAYQAFTHRRRLQDDEDAVLSQLAAAYYAVDLPAARAHAAEAVGRFPDSVEARRWAAKMERIDDMRDLLIDVARTLCRQRRYADSLDLFVAALEMRDSPEARLWLGRAFLALGRAADAVPLLESAAAELPGDPTICVDVAAAYAAGGRADVARAWLEQGARVHPRSGDVGAALARVALRQGDAHWALAQAERTARAAPDDAGAWLATAEARDAAGDRQGARLAVDRAVALDPDRVSGWRLGARLVEADGDAGLASHYLVRAATLVGEPPPETTRPGSLRTEIDRLYARIVRNPEEVGAYRDRATVNGLLDLPQRALYFLDLTIRDIAREPTPALLVERAGLLLRLGRTEDARTSCEEALRLEPTNEPARRGLEAIASAGARAESVDDPAEGSARPVQAAPRTADAPPVSSPGTVPQPPGPAPTRFCRRCGQELPAAAAFCRRCGAGRT